MLHFTYGSIDFRCIAEGYIVHKPYFITHYAYKCSTFRCIWKQHILVRFRSDIKPSSADIKGLQVNTNVCNIIITANRDAGSPLADIPDVKATNPIPLDNPDSFLNQH